MSIEKDLGERFTDAIRKSLPRCPLIGPKWYCYDPDGKPAHFRFVCMDKLVKATGLKPKVLAKRILENLDLGGLRADVRVAEDFEIRIKLKQSQGGSEK